MVFHPTDLNVNGITSVQQATKIIGHLSHPSKIPAWGYSLPAKRCITGSKLENIEGSTCCKENCYAKRGWYPKRKVIINAMERRFRSIKNPKWVDGMVFMIKWHLCKFFRWHDSGDLQSIEHLHKIVKVAEACPDVWFWLPTREYDIVAKYKKLLGNIPRNLVIRLSGMMIDGPAPTPLAQKLGIVSSIVSTKGNHTCPASTKKVLVHNGQKKIQEGFCGSCRNCWNPDIPVIIYKFH